MSEPEPDTVPITRRTVVEIVLGYALILGLIAGMFGFAGGIDLDMPWGVMAAIGAIGAGMALAAWRRRA
jgi:hypothetical protein